MEACEVCGFVWDEVTAEELPGRLRAAGEGFRSVMASGHPTLGVKPDATTWSAVECTAHTRDVLFNLRDRIVTGMAEDVPTPYGLYTDLRVEAGLFAAETPAQLAVDVPVAAGMFARTVEAMDAVQLARLLNYPWPRDAPRSLLWVAAQALHEAEHHLDDVRRSVG